jgi:hypothetical protein
VARRGNAGEKKMRWKAAWVCAVSDGVPRRSLWVALIVGTLLNLINQGDALVAGRPLDLGKLVLTYVVPYFVCTYGAVSLRLRAERGTAPPRN